MVVRAEPDRPDDRLERWKRKLLDLTAKNKLLNFRDARKAVEIDVGDAGRLEDMLSAGTKFRFLPRSDVLDGTDGRDAGLHRARHNDDGRRAFVAQALEAGDLHTRLGPDELEGRLTELFRLARTAFEEGGSNVLYLALGFLTWVQAKGGKPYRAPILLIPVALKRRSVRGGFRMELHEEEARFNPTLVEMLRQDFDLRMPEFERELPTDASGLAVDKIWQGLRHHVKDVPGWEVTPDVALSTFSFTKFLMWRDLVDRVEALKANPVVRHLIDTPKHSYGDGSGAPEPRHIDRDHHPREIFAPLSADSSQLAAVMAAARGRDFVLHGPPGTGKSQTIANMIAQCLASGRTVLFVSQKTAALEVVQRRLRDIGLGSYCLEVHSTKAQKSAVLSQLREAWHDRQAPTAQAWEVATEDLARLRDELNRLVASLHRRHDNGLTPYETFGRVVANRYAWPGLRLGWEGLDREPMPLDALRAICRDAETALRAVGLPAAHPLRGLAVCEWTPSWRDAIVRATDAHGEALPRAAEAGSAFATALGFQDLPTSWDVLPALAAFGAVLASEDAGPGAAFLSAGASARRQALAMLAELQSRAAPVRGRLRGEWRDAVFDLDLRAKLEEWAHATASNVLVRSGRQKRVRDGFSPYAIGRVPDDLGHELVALAELSGLRVEAAALGREFAGSDVPWRGLDADAAVLARGAAWADAARGAAAALGEVTGHAPDVLRDYVLTLVADYPDLFASGGAARQAHAELLAALDAARRASADLASLAGLDASGWPLVEGPNWASDSVALASGWKAALNRAQPWIFWIRTARDARAAGLGAVIDAASDGTVAPGAIEVAFVAAHARWWADVAVGTDPVLSGFVAERHEDAIRRFQMADARVGELAQRIVAARLRGDVPAPNAFGADAEWGTLNHEMVKKARHLPIRQLFSRIPTALTKLTPCVMMSPLSIAQYLPAESRPFDLVIFDEASQIPVWDAIGAIARGRQVVVVGDPEQLPPTSVGERGVDEVEDGIDVEDQESILGECLAANIPSRRLDWHYRSRHESLIAFSNRAYYGNHLVTFPSPAAEDRAVRLVPVPAGVYQRGRDRINVKEAEAVVDEVVRRLEEPAFAAERLSLGVVTFNGQQQRLIENLLDKAQLEHPDIVPFFDPQRWHEPVFVKNLESVQGDERDVILFSVTFAPDEAGRPVSTVSSLNKDGGHRRLNVAITRARREMVVFATLRPDQIQITGQGARGIRDFKHFLEFAERGPRALAEAASPLDRDTESPFEDAVRAALEGDGWTVHPQVGVSAFRIDLGVVHPDAPGRYLAGVECDGATYHRSATARDRDRLRQNVLVGLGWRIRRVWSTDWWMDAETATGRLLERLRQDLTEDRGLRASVPQETAAATALPEAGRAGPGLAPTGAREEVEVAVRSLTDTDEGGQVAPVVLAEAERERQRAYARQMVPGAAEGSVADPASYVPADLSDPRFGLDPPRFHDPGYAGILAFLVSHVIAVEGPLFDDVLVTRVARAHGFARSGGRIREAVLTAVDSGHPRTEEAGRFVLWPVGHVEGASVRFRAGATDVRDHQDVPTAELEDLAGRLPGSDEELVRLMAAELGMSKVREQTRQRFLRAARASKSRLGSDGS